MRRVIHLLAAVAVCLASLPILAQSSGNQDRDRDAKLENEKTIESDLQRAQFRWGPFYLLSRLEFGDLSIDGDLYVPAAEEADDFTLLIRAPQKLYIPFSRRFLISTEVTPTYVWFEKLPDELDWKYRGDLHFVLNHLYLDFWGAGGDELKRDYSELRTLVEKQSNQYGVNGELKLSSRTSLDFAGDFDSIEYREGDRPVIDEQLDQLVRDDTTWQLRLRHRTFAITSTTIGIVNTRHDFQLFDTRDSDETHLLVGLHQNTAKRAIDIQIGHGSLDFDDPNERDYSGFVGSAQLSFTPTYRWKLGLQGERRLEFSTFEANTHYTADRIGFTTGVRVAKRVDVGLRLEAGQNRYFEISQFTESQRPERRRDDLSLIGLDVDVNVWRSLAIGIGGGWWKRDSNIAGYDDDGIRIFLRLSYKPVT